MYPSFVSLSSPYVYRGFSIPAVNGWLLVIEEMAVTSQDNRMFSLQVYLACILHYVAYLDSIRFLSIVVIQLGSSYLGLGQRKAFDFLYRLLFFISLRFISTATCLHGSPIDLFD